MIIRKSEKGFAMVLSLVLLLAMSLMGGALILISSGDHQSNNNSDQYQQTFYAAEMALLQGEKYILNEKSGPWDGKSTRDTSKANLPEDHTSPFLGTMSAQNYNPGAKYKFTSTIDRKFINTGTSCFKSYRDIDRDNPDAKKRMKVATVYLGYADGLPQHVKDGTAVKVNNQDANIFGKISMDVTTIDVSDIKECNVGDWCEFFSPSHSINNLASANGLISYDIMIRIKSRVERVYKKIS